jgi:hypothetical protein
VLGDGFVLSVEEGKRLIAKNPKNSDVIFPYLVNKDLTTRPDQSPSRMVIDFKDWPLDRKNAKLFGPVATDYPDCLDIIEKLVKPERAKINDNNATGKRRKKIWWLYGSDAKTLYQAIAPFNKVLVYGTQASKYLLFCFSSTDIIFSNAVGIISHDSQWLFSILNSNFHSIWARKYSSTMGSSTLRYTPSDSFETFPFPPGLEPNNKNPSNPRIAKLDTLGERLDISRREITSRLNTGLTKLYNLYHAKELDIQTIMSVLDCSEPDAAWAVENIIKLRGLQKEIDETVLAAYGWNELYLEHGFSEIEFLPESDRTRYTVSNNARREILQRLLALNHERHKEEAETGLVDEKGRPLKKKAKKGKINRRNSGFLFDAEEREEFF